MFSVVHAGNLGLSVDRLRLVWRRTWDCGAFRSRKKTLFIFDCRCSGRARDGGIRFRGFLAGRAWLRTRVPRLRFIHVHAGGIRLSVDRLSVSRKTLLRFINVHASSLLLSVAMTRRFPVARRALAPEPSSASAEHAVC